MKRLTTETLAKLHLYKARQLLQDKAFKAKSLGSMKATGNKHFLEVAHLFQILNVDEGASL